MHKKKLSLKKLMELDAHDNMTGVGVPFMGGQTKFGSGNFGRGGETQLAAYLSPPTQNLKDMTEEENEKLFIDSPTVEEGIEPEHLEELVNIGRNQSMDLPRSPANKDNALVAPKHFTPMNASYKDTDSRTGMPAEYMDNIEQGPEGDPSWPVGIGEDKLHLKPKHKKIDGKIEKLLGDKQAKDLEDGKEGHKLSASDLVLYNMIEQLIEEERINEHVDSTTPTGAGGTYPSKQGWNNTKIASLCAHKNNMDPSKPPAEVWHNKFEENDDQNPLMTQHAPEADSSPMGGMGMIGWPKQFVPKDIEQDPNYEQFTDSPNGNRGVIDSTRPNNMMNLNLKEFMEARLKRKLKKRSKKNKSTSAYKNGLPSNNAPGNPKPMNGAIAFEKSRESVLSQLKEAIKILVEAEINQKTVAPSGRRGKVSAPGASKVDATAPTLLSAEQPSKKAPPATPITTQEFGALQNIFKDGVFDENDLNNVHYYFYKMLINKQVPKFTTQIEAFPNMEKFNSAVLASNSDDLQAIVAKVASMNEFQLGELEGAKKKEIGDPTIPNKKDPTVDVTSAVQQLGSRKGKEDFQDRVAEYQDKLKQAGMKPNTAQWMTAMMPANKQANETEAQAAERIARLASPVINKEQPKSMLQKIGGRLGLNEVQTIVFLKENNIKTPEGLRVLVKIINEMHKRQVPRIVKPGDMIWVKVEHAGALTLPFTYNGPAIFIKKVSEHRAQVLINDKKYYVESADMHTVNKQSMSRGDSFINMGTK